MGSLKFFVIVLLSIFLFSCGNDSNNAEKNVLDNTLQVSSSMEVAKIIEPLIDDELVVLEQDGVILTEIKSQNNAAASIHLNTNQFKEGVNALNFKVEGITSYNIAYLANNYLLSEYSTDVFEKEFMYGNNVFLAFLTDENKVSVKNNNGSVLKNAVVGGAENMFEMNQEHLFYYLPESVSEQPVLDFYLVNSSLSKDGNKVKVIINSTEFIIDKWAAYQITGLSNLENTIRIQLINNEGNLIDGPFNDSGDRSFAVKPVV